MPFEDATVHSRFSPGVKEQRVLLFSKSSQNLENNRRDPATTLENARKEKNWNFVGFNFFAVDLRHQLWKMEAFSQLEMTFEETT